MRTGPPFPVQFLRIIAPLLRTISVESSVLLIKNNALPWLYPGRTVVDMEKEYCTKEEIIYTTYRSRTWSCSMVFAARLSGSDIETREVRNQTKMVLGGTQ